MSNFLKPIDLTDRAIRRAVFAVLDGLSAEHRANRKGSERFYRCAGRCATVPKLRPGPNRRNDDAGKSLVDLPRHNRRLRQHRRADQFRALLRSLLLGKGRSRTGAADARARCQAGMLLFSPLTRRVMRAPMRARNSSFGVCAQIIGAESQALHRRCSDYRNLSGDKPTWAGPHSPRVRLFGGASGGWVKDNLRNMQRTISRVRSQRRAGQARTLLQSMQRRCGDPGAHPPHAVAR